MAPTAQKDVRGAMVKEGTMRDPHLCTHDESYEEGDHRHSQDQQLSAVSSPERLRVHVHHSCHQTLHAHKLQKRRLNKSSPRVHSPFIMSIFYVRLFNTDLLFWKKIVEIGS